MTWNEPGQDKDPWGNRKKSNDGPPDLDKVIQDLSQKFKKMFGGTGSGQSTGDGSEGPMLGALLAVLLLLWGVSGFYKIDDAERGVVLRFGSHLKTTLPGLRWHIPWPVETVEKVNVAEIMEYPHQTLMLTADENIVYIGMTVQFRISDAKDYLFNVRNARMTLNDLAESAIREIAGTSTQDFVLTTGRSDIVKQTRELIQETLDEYGTGIQVTSVNLTEATLPKEVQQAVQDATRAGQDAERMILEADAYKNDILPRARGKAARQIKEAEGYKERVVADAEGEVARFLKLLIEYKKAPQVTRERLYLETMESVMSASNKVILDAKGSGNVMYLPIDKLVAGQRDQEDKR